MLSLMNDLKEKLPLHPFWGSKTGPFLTPKTGPFLTPKMGPFLTPKMGPKMGSLISAWGPEKCDFTL